MGRRIYVVAGEVSGDIHAAELMRGLLAEDPDLTFMGLGGPEMREVGGDGIEEWLGRSAVMGVVEVLKHYSFFKEKLEVTTAQVIAEKPDLLLTVDYPGFNLRLAAAVKERAPEIKTAQYVCPQVWAWKKGRIPKIAACIDHLLCLFPFEPEIFEGYDIDACFVGNPLVDELEVERIEDGRLKGLVGLFPGSREKEVERLLPVMLEAAKILHSRQPDLKFEVPGATPVLTELLQSMIDQAGLPADLSLRVTAGGSRQLMQRAECGVIASGTATLEASYFGLPYCLVYKLAPVTYLIAQIVVKIQFIGIINILANRAIVKELIQGEATGENVSHELLRFLSDAEAKKNVTADLLETSQLLGDKGVSHRAAQTVMGWLPEKTPPR